MGNHAGRCLTDTGDGMHRGGKSRNVVEQRERREVIGAAGIVAPVLTGADQDPVARGKTKLADLNISPVVVQGDFARDSDSASI